MEGCLLTLGAACSVLQDCSGMEKPSGSTGGSRKVGEAQGVAVSGPEPHVGCTKQSELVSLLSTSIYPTRGGVHLPGPAGSPPGSSAAAQQGALSPFRCVYPGCAWGGRKGRFTEWGRRKFQNRGVWGAQKVTHELVFCKRNNMKQIQKHGLNPVHSYFINTTLRLVTAEGQTLACLSF